MRQAQAADVRCVRHHRVHTETGDEAGANRFEEHGGAVVRPQRDRCRQNEADAPAASKIALRRGLAAFGMEAFSGIFVMIFVFLAIARP